MVLVEAQATGLKCVISENAPCPDLLGTLAVLNLADDNDTWANELTNIDYSCPRKEAQKKVTAGGYDISCEALKLQDFYLTYGIK